MAALFLFGGKEDTASWAFAGDGSVWILAKGGLLGDDGGGFIRLVLNGEPVPEPGPDTGCLEDLSL